ncbi:metalloregulator ArsR/SmtB family transcription factor [Ammoniphilus sp. YIM 78166]|uniref:metalloregulator ArsR/SmtB family transcription factor n=1 Tax=Ammoniphilus sp. YIM 78166 TaxID=1644106 RepID=UPI0010701A0E|nr:metalloregulator ArsR/SmtB family transcription factor [Ammoniphilus sp. YIM 78166]
MNGHEITDIFKALAHPSRVEILDYLKDGPLTTGELSDKFNVSRYAIMKHLNILESAGLVVVRRQGRIRLNFLHALPLQQLYNRWVSQYESQLASSLLRLKNNLEDHKGDLNNMENNQEKIAMSSFQIEQEVVINVPRERVFQALTDEINEWWAIRLGTPDSKFTFEPKINGLFYEDWGNGQGSVWGTVIYFKEHEEIRLNGLLGMQGAVNSNYIYKLEERGNSTLLKLSHQAAGLLEPHWEEAHQQGWNELLGKHLKAYLEDGLSVNQYSSCVKE